MLFSLPVATLSFGDCSSNSLAKRQHKGSRHSSWVNESQNCSSEGLFFHLRAHFRQNTHISLGSTRLNPFLPPMGFRSAWARTARKARGVGSAPFWSPGGSSSLRKPPGGFEGKPRGNRFGARILTGVDSSTELIWVENGDPRFANPCLIHNGGGSPSFQANLYILGRSPYLSGWLTHVSGDWRLQVTQGTQEAMCKCRLGRKAPRPSLCPLTHWPFVWLPHSC